MVLSCRNYPVREEGIAVHVPKWIPNNCTQCNQCSYVCPHAAIRPFLLTDEELAKAPKGTETVKGIGTLKDYNYRIQVSVLDCTGCGNCIDVCPAKTKALEFRTLDSQMAESERFEYMNSVVGYKDTVVEKDKNVKNSQFAQPLFEFSGACAGCGETPYLKAITQIVWRKNDGSQCHRLFFNLRRFCTCYTLPCKP